MKLLFKVTFYYLTIAAVVFGIGGIMTYDIFQKEVQFETDLYLQTRLNSIENAIESGQPIAALVSNNISIQETVFPVEDTEIILKDTLADHPSPSIDRLEEHRKLSTIRNLNGKSYKIELFDVILESDDIYAGVFTSQTRLFIILGVVLAIASFLVSAWLLRPFNITVSAIKNFSLQDLELPKLANTSTKEFKVLNKFLDQMLHKVKDDYRNLKEFSENASHEMQTPLAVTKGKLELLLQSKNLNECEHELIQSAYNSIDHLSKMNRSLGLLTKIENKEFTDRQDIDLTEKIKTSLFDFNELMELRQIRLSQELEERVSIHSDPVLIQILLTNLLQNAIRHNVEEGEIDVKLVQGKFTIANTGEPLINSFDSLFERFKKDNQSGNTIGLGLAIVKKICDQNNFRINYQYTEGKHVLELTF